MKSHSGFHFSTCVLVLVSVRGKVALGKTEAADGAAAVGPFPIVAMIWPWELMSSCGDTVWTCRPWAGNAEAAAAPASDAGLTSRGSVPITWYTSMKIMRLIIKNSVRRLSLRKNVSIKWINTFKCSTNLALCISNELTCESCHIRHGTGEDGSCSERADELRLSSKRSCTNLKVGKNTLD